MRAFYCSKPQKVPKIEEFITYLVKILNYGCASNIKTTFKQNILNILKFINCLFKCYSYQKKVVSLIIKL